METKHTYYQCTGLKNNLLKDLRIRNFGVAARASRINENDIYDILAPGNLDYGKNRIGSVEIIGTYTPDGNWENGNQFDVIELIVNENPNHKEAVGELHTFAKKYKPKSAK